MSAGPDSAPHIPVLLGAILRQVGEVQGTWLDGTMGAGGYSRAFLEAGATHLVCVDQDPLAHDMALDWVGDYAGRVTLVEANFQDMDQFASDLDGVVLDLGVSSMQLDQADRGFSFMRDGPLDMRMSQDGPSAADIVNTYSETEIADILYNYGEERQSRRIARKIVEVRKGQPFETTLQLVEVIESCLPRSKPGQAHPATRSFQGLRIAVNDEYGALWRGLMAAERALKPGGLLVVVTFHSIEDRMVKRFFQAHGDKKTRVNRYASEAPVETDAPFQVLTRKAIGPDAKELARNPRARSAKLRVGRRTTAPARDIEASDLSMPMIENRS
ncbi:MAG: 16S rRNA (cytosine(1402)-N(4))-methyltransferase RsmH [Pelagimonas sp.]|jgi:16S rRNA (cytosine1402-N4)-methyltransferase|nr:16S rRNA (cytosine(1402)-N(4))-methyltransferase RsmH [Pelagimonas sp.]